MRFLQLDLHTQTLIIREAINNCIRHGSAQEARVSLTILKQGVRLSIRDMAARAQKIGGRFKRVLENE